MPRLTSPKLEELTLPGGGDDPAIVTVDTSITAKQALDLSEAENKNVAAVELIASAIQSWNYTDSNGNSEPVTAEAVARLPIDDFVFLAEHLTAKIADVMAGKSIGEDEKKA